MPRYIDADKAPSIMQEMPMGKQVIDVVMKYVIDRLPTEDVVEVVRCKDCKHARKAVDGYYHCRVDGCIAHNETDYCSCGERRSEDG